MEDKFINPYTLLGVKTTSSISELKKNYYNLSLLTHPDKGGSADDFRIVYDAYQYIKPQLENVKDVSYEELEQDFADFCSQQMEEKKPTFYEVNIEANDWLNQFNSQFESNTNNSNSEKSVEFENPFSIGYGTYMDPSEINLDTISTPLERELKYDSDYPTEEELQEHEKFIGEIIPFEEPDFMPNYVKYLPLHKTKIGDFSNLEGNLKSCDYKLAHSEVLNPEKNLESEIKKIGNHPNFGKFPIDKQEYKPEL